MNDVKVKTGALLKETAVLTGAVAIIAAGVYFFSGAEPYIRQQHFRPWHRAVQFCAAALVDHYDDQKLMNFINREDPKAFVTIYNVSSVQYQPKT